MNQLVIAGRKTTLDTVSILCYVGGLDLSYDDNNKEKLFYYFEIIFMNKEIMEKSNCCEIIDYIMYKCKMENKIEFWIWGYDSGRDEYGNDGHIVYEDVILKHFKLYCRDEDITQFKKEKYSADKNCICLKYYFDGKKQKARREIFNRFMGELVGIHSKISVLKNKKNKDDIKRLLKIKAKKELVEKVLNVVNIYDAPINAWYYSKGAMCLNGKYLNKNII